MIPPRNVVLLFAGQVVFVTGTVIVVTLGGIVGSHIAPLGSHPIQRFIQFHDETILLSYPSGSTMTVMGGMPSWSRA